MNTPTSLTTMTSSWLLQELKKPQNHTAWEQFVGRYRPMLIGYCQRFGFRGADAEDIAQVILSTFAQAYQDGKYDRDKGRLRHWLFGIARNQLLAATRKRGREVNVAGNPDQTDFFVQLPDEQHMTQVWDAQWRDGVLAECLKQVRHEVDDKTYQAFELFVRTEWPARKVAEHLDITENAIFCAKRRILRRMRELIEQIESIW